MKITVLGCGSSYGTPRLGCSCSTCLSPDPRNKRTRCSILIESSGTRVLIDAGPDFRAQALTHGISDLDAVIFTHAHSDHIAGINDFRSLYYIKGERINSFMTQQTYDDLLISNSYAFVAQDEFYSPFMKASIIKEQCDLNIGDLDFKVFPQNHGVLTTIGLRIGGFAYCTDFKTMPEQSLKEIEGCSVLIVEALRFETSQTHQSLEEALELIELVKPKQAYLTHMDHELEYRSLCNILPKNVLPLHDGLIINA